MAQLLLQIVDDTFDSAAEITTLRRAIVVFSRHVSPRVLAGGLSLAVIARLTAGAFVGWSRWDLVSVLVVFALVPLVEWFVHRVILHAKPQAVGSKVIDLGAGHRQHHLQPLSIDWVLLGGPEALVFQVMNAGLAVVVLVPLLNLLDVVLTGPVLTGVVAALAALAHYEWAHFLFHTGYRPKTRYYRRLKRNHRLHHWRDQRYWLGITSNAGDRLLRTYPAGRTR